MNQAIEFDLEETWTEVIPNWSELADEWAGLRLWQVSKDERFEEQNATRTAEICAQFEKHDVVELLATALQRRIDVMDRQELSAFITHATGYVLRQLS